MDVHHKVGVQTDKAYHMKLHTLHFNLENFYNDNN